MNGNRLQRLAAVPDAITAAVLLSLWMAPLWLGPRAVSNALLTMLVEFVLVHAAGMLGGLLESRAHSAGRRRSRPRLWSALRRVHRRLRVGVWRMVACRGLCLAVAWQGARSVFQQSGQSPTSPTTSSHVGTAGDCLSRRSLCHRALAYSSLGHHRSNSAPTRPDRQWLMGRSATDRGGGGCAVFRNPGIGEVEGLGRLSTAAHATLTTQENHLPRGLARWVACAVHGSSGHGCLG